MGGGVVTATRSFEPVASSVRAAREFVAGLIDGPDSFRHDVALVVSELVANSVLHAGTDVAVTVTARGPSLRLEVADGSARAPHVSEHRIEAPSGRGLRIVDALTDRIGVLSRTDGKVVWVEMGVGA